MIVRMNLTAVFDVLPSMTLIIIHDISYKYFCNSSPSPEERTQWRCVPWMLLAMTSLNYISSFEKWVFQLLPLSTDSGSGSVSSAVGDLPKEPQWKGFPLQYVKLFKFCIVCKVLILHLSPPFNSYAPGFHSGDKWKHRNKCFPLCLSTEHGEEFGVYSKDSSNQKFQTFMYKICISTVKCIHITHLVRQ